ncbi:uncharacterized protein LOC120357754 [Solenopsis invicta]|uniref:uncharacterized protein LOC120357754 n=1 Tax=Solenopsis invicta TaxID=13686 RepID=UPI00193E2936|nr:uncharacterized protein LOC120357754 [Solenopsis invicta]
MMKDLMMDLQFASLKVNPFNHQIDELQQIYRVQASSNYVIKRTSLSESISSTSGHNLVQQNVETKDFPDTLDITIKTENVQVNDLEYVHEWNSANTANATDEIKSSSDQSNAAHNHKVKIIYIYIWIAHFDINEGILKDVLQIMRCKGQSMTDMEKAMVICFDEVDLSNQIAIERRYRTSEDLKEL